MTSRLAQSNGSAPLHNTTTITVNRTLPIMSAPQPPPQVSGQHIPRFQTGNHRRKPPEQSAPLFQSKHSQPQHAAPKDIREPPHLTHRNQDSQNPNVDQAPSHPDSGMGLESSSSSNDGPGQYLEQPSGRGGAQQMQLDSSAGSGDSSGAEGMLAANGSGGSGQSKLTRKSTAEDWFNAFNRDVRGNQSYPNYDNDSPYYLPSQHRKKHQQGARSAWPPRVHSGGFPERSSIPNSYRGGPVQVLESTEESNSDSFRSVIDDLTIKNQRLKRRLRRLEGLHGQHATHAERLFELRVHDLPEEKKAELERILQSFTANIENERAAQEPSSRNGFPSGNRSSAIDSGYASVSRSGNDSSVPSSGQGRDSRRDDSGKPWPSSHSSAHSNSETTKMKLVVRRLEQLFTGGVAGADDGRVGLQQNVSDLAKAEDNEATLMGGGFLEEEGARGASLMSPPRNPFIDSDSKESLLTADEPEQRPTRPIDLDPQREQVAVDNIEYLTHLTGSGTKGVGTGGGWVYLNLMINMAQLHTINVTPPFIKKAIAAASDNLELSPDGKMVRWRGNGEMSPPEFSMSSGRGEGSSDDGCRRGFESSGSGSGPGINEPELQPVEKNGTDHRFHYKPMFARSQSFDEESSSLATSSDTDPEAPRRSNSGESRNSSSKRDSGPIIFYKGGGFCTDLTSQPLREEEGEMDMTYERATSRPLGSATRCPPSPSTRDDSPLFRLGTAFAEPQLYTSKMDADPDDLSDIEFSPQFTATSPTMNPAVPIEFEASGVGGVLPADNFAINCQTRHYLLPDNHGRLPVSRSRALKSKLHKRILHRIPKASIDAFHDKGNATDSSAGSSSSSSETSGAPSSRHRRPVRHELLSANTLRLPPSSLPPASYMFASPSEDSSSNGETDSDDAPRSSGSEGYFFHQSLDAYRTSSGEENEAATGFQRSPSSAATAGDGGSRRESSVFSDHIADGQNYNDPTYDDPLSMDSEQSSDSADIDVQFLGDDADVDRPNLKRSRGSVISSTSNHQARKSVRMTNINLQSSTESDES
ncbi:frequency clock protein-domain-containing protein [Tricharina praecox]|uniref:frequency clock protein-domain-containing protein n=1 Tax=Tricharina praecox TaxID=43433 RepID=UPI00221E7196|nr:frequency clock protein-domain-containing protein [Tricharina praecox]KAI5855327.1 frequency clock protein-domain-containing protein [Tricharina praecox]